MKRLLVIPALLVLVLALVSTAVSPPRQAAAAAPIPNSGSQSFAHAQFSSESGGVQTFTFVDASDFAESGPFGDFEASSAFVAIDQFEGGTHQGFSGFADLTPEQFRASADLTSATLTAVVNVCAGAECFDVTLNLSWSGSGQTQTFSGKAQVRAGGNCRIHSTFTDSHREASATGTVSRGATNLTPNPSDFADIGAGRFNERFTGDCSHLFPPPPGP